MDAIGIVDAIKTMEALEIVEILKDAKKRIKNPIHWCQDSLARNARGACDPSQDASQWCGVGSIIKTTYIRDTSYETRNKVLKAINDKCQQKYGSGISTVNDSHGHTALLECFDAAIEDLRNAAAPIKDEMEL